MFKKISQSLLASIPVILISNFITSNPANASTLSNGSISITFLEDAEFVNNAIDFDADGTDFIPGSIENGGSFTVTFADGDFLNLSPSFLGATGIMTDIYTPESIIPDDVIPGIPSMSFVDGVSFNLVEILTDAGLTAAIATPEPGFSGIPFLFFDLDGDGDFTDDAIYHEISLIRTSELGPSGIESTIDFGGFLFSPSGLFETTFADFSLTSTSLSDFPENLPSLDVPIPVVLGGGIPDLGEFFPGETDIAGGEGIITSTPEPATIVGLSVVLGFAGLLPKQKGKKLNSKTCKK